MDLDFDYWAARDKGYSDDDILAGLQQSGKLGFDLKAAKAQGYSSADIMQGLIGTQTRPVPEKPEETSALRRVGDIGISALKGAISVPETVVGLADLVSGGAAGRAAESLGFRPKEARETLNELYSPQQQAANRKVAEAEGFLGTAGAILQNPSVALQTGIESLPLMGAGGVVGRGAVALAPRIGAALGGALGEGVVQAGQAAEQYRQGTPGGELSLGQAGAALASGIGTGAFGAVGGRIAQKLGIGDIDTALVAAGAPVQSSKGVIRRLVEGGISEGVFEELPQSIQEQIWQNAAMDKPLLDGVGENAAQGLIAGGLFGGIAGAALHGKAPVTPEVNPQTGEPLLLENRPDPFISFPDGSVGRQSDADAFIASLPEEQRIEARARLYGYQSQPVTEQDVLDAQSVDQAIQIANRAIEEGTPEFRAQRDSEIDTAWNQYLNERASVRMQEFEAAQEQRRLADIPAMRDQLADQAVEQAAALTQAQGFGEDFPTAMQQAMQRAQERAAQRENANAAATGPGLRNVDVAGAENLASLQPGAAAGLPVAGELAVAGTPAAVPAERPAAEGLANATAPAGAAALEQPVAQPSPRTSSLQGEPASWVIRNKDTGEVIAETFDKKKVKALNTAKYEAVPVQQHLGEINTPGTRQYALARGEQPQNTPQNIPETIPAAEVGPAANEDDGSDIPVGFMRRVKVPHEVWVQDENQYETTNVPADKALAAVREDIADLRSLLKCLRG